MKKGNVVDEENEEEEEGEDENKNSSDSDDDVDVTISSRLLDCPVCFEPMHVPLFQCMNGHVMCSACSDKLGKKCYLCASSNTSRCLVLESILESNKVKCPYSEFGCQISQPHSQIIPHKAACMYVPCSCPILECNFKSSEQMLTIHIYQNHRKFKQQMFFVYGRSFTISLQKGQHMYILRGRNDVYVVLNRRVEVGSALWIAHMSTGLGNVENSCELEVEDAVGNSLKLKGLIENVRNLKKGNKPKFFLTVPQELFGATTGEVDVKVRIWNQKKKWG